MLPNYAIKYNLKQHFSYIQRNVKKNYPKIKKQNNIFVIKLYILIKNNWQLNNKAKFRWFALLSQYNFARQSVKRGKGDQSVHPLLLSLPLVSQAKARSIILCKELRRAKHLIANSQTVAVSVGAQSNPRVQWTFSERDRWI